ncbi:NHL repeat-containing protein, partial [Acrasis kona]
SGLLYTFAGNENGGYNGDGILATSAYLNSPTGVAIDNKNNLVYIADKGNHRIRVVDLSNNIISTVAGSNTSGIVDGVDASISKLNSPSSVAVDDNLVYIADTSNQRIRMVNLTSGIIRTIAGNGNPGSNINTAQGSVATTSWLYNPYGVAVDSVMKNIIYIADTQNSYVKAVNRASNTVTVIAGTGYGGFNGDKIDAKTAKLGSPTGIIMGPNNTIYIAETSSNCVRTIDNQGIISTVAGTCGSSNGYGGDNGPAKSALMFQPYGIGIDGTNNIIYVADTNNYRVRSVASNYISTIVGVGFAGFYGDYSNDLTSVRFNLPQGMLINNNIMYIADYNNNRIRAINLNTNMTTTFCGTGVQGQLGDNGDAASAQLSSPRATSINKDVLYIVDVGSSRIRAVNLTSNIITTIAGIGSAGYNGDNMAATSTKLSLPSAVNVDVTRNVAYIAEQNSHRIRLFNLTTGNITTIAGTGSGGYNGDNIAATSAKIYSPYGSALDVVNNLIYIADTSNHRIRVVDRTTGNITTFAGTGVAGYNGDNIAATSATLYSPYGVAVDNVNNLVYIADTSNHRIRIVDTTTGIIRTLAGTGSAGYNGDNYW